MAEAKTVRVFSEADVRTMLSEALTSPLPPDEVVSEVVASHESELTEEVVARSAVIRAMHRAHQRARTTNAPLSNGAAQRLLDEVLAG
jgi:hypothetical protein